MKLVPSPNHVLRPDEYMYQKKRFLSWEGGESEGVLGTLWAVEGAPQGSINLMDTKLMMQGGSQGCA